MTTAAELGPGGLDAAGRPIFVATEHTKFSPSVDRELTDQEQLAWKSFQLWRTSMAIDRRDKVYESIMNSDYTSFRLSYHIMGTPFPVIEENPSVPETFKSVRLYEHAACATAAYAYSVWIRAKTSTRYARLMPQSRAALSYGSFLLGELCLMYRSSYRLQGYLPNDYECQKYGVKESKERLEKKKEMWDKYTNYKREWCRRFDYHVYGIRPGENWNLFSACWFPAWEPSYCKRTDYPLRKNPYFLSAAPLSKMFSENRTWMDVPKQDNVPLIQARPELKYTYHGPLDANKSPK